MQLTNLALLNENKSFNLVQQLTELMHYFCSTSPELGQLNKLFSRFTNSQKLRPLSNLY